ncbi:hypothetical protein CesoFtcFv8_017007 [Champsocephalus esox]|uniref:Uncharacterized protein n=2 Tax=Champsocephalus TaxID=52236 RepID=A0AAN8D944_CHAGU|nr:hypothetical protein CesoFtcFv8_017007 [Champsocephalus esox]KAK5916398.1 hypothetical protein CgunFtcFv8_011387 [Champsocephalus gunnari]
MSPERSAVILINMFGWTLISRRRRFVVLVDWAMSEDLKKVYVCACTCAVVSLGGVGFGGGQVSVVDGTVVLRASICETQWEES